MLKPVIWIVCFGRLTSSINTWNHSIHWLRAKVQIKKHFCINIWLNSKVIKRTLRIFKDIKVCRIQKIQLPYQWRQNLFCLIFLTIYFRMKWKYCANKLCSSAQVIALSVYRQTYFMDHSVLDSEHPENNNNFTQILKSRLWSVYFLESYLYKPYTRESRKVQNPFLEIK